MNQSCRQTAGLWLDEGGSRDSEACSYRLAVHWPSQMDREGHQQQGAQHQVDVRHQPHPLKDQQEILEILLPNSLLVREVGERDPPRKTERFK